MKNAVKLWNQATYNGVGSQKEAAKAILEAAEIALKTRPDLVQEWSEYTPPIVAIATGNPATDGYWPGGDEDDASFAIQWLCEKLNISDEEGLNV
jgi:hypothetical protein